MRPLPLGWPSVYDSSALRQHLVQTLLAFAALVTSAAQSGCSTRTLTAFPTPEDAAAGDANQIPDAGPVGEPDLPPSSDLRPSPDLPASPDLAVQPDLPMSPDLPVPPDLTGEPVADLVQADRTNADRRADVRPDLPDGGSGVRTLFYDGFDDGYAHNWSTSESSDGPITDATDGSNKLATFDSTQADYTRLRCNLDGSFFTDIDISASMKIRIDRAPASTRTVRLDVRQASSTANIFYAVGATVNTAGAIARVSIFKKVSDGMGDYTECELAPGPAYSPALPMGDWRTIKLTISGSTTTKMTAFLDGNAVATFTDDCTSPITATNGQIVANGGCLVGLTGLGIQVEKGIKASVDDVLVTAL